jgi:hypothetical protein
MFSEIPRRTGTVHPVHTRHVAHRLQSLPQAQLMREIRRRAGTHLYDHSGVTAAGVAIYSLSDPRNVREIRYVGQTIAPRRRLLQHLSAARLWLPHEKPWWVKAPKLRPLYCWVREIFQDEARLPVMLVLAWVDAAEARLAERRQIQACVERRLPLLNAGTESLRQLELFVQ